MAALVEEAGRDYNFVIIDIIPLAAVTDPQKLRKFD
jgi:hypothetical protein